MTGNEILKTALLGTDKYTPQAPVSLSGTGSKIMALPTDKEDRFLKLAITSLLYEEAGRKPVLIEGSMPECPAEILPYIDDKLSGKLKNCLSTKDDVLFDYFLYLARTRNQVLTADLVPLVLNKALQQKNMAGLLVSACGETGKWLCSLNPNWKILVDEQKDENVWDTGNIESRKAYLAKVRSSDPAKAIELLEGIIDKENAANRVVLIEVLHVNLSLADEPFLEKIRHDKSAKVKEIATNLLQNMQGSAINRSYLNYLLNVILVKEERYMLISKRNVLTIRQDLLPDEHIFSTGIERICSDKNVPDHIHIIRELVRFIDPTILSTRLGTSEEELITLLLQQKEADLLAASLATTAGNFRNRTWALHMLNKNETRYLVLLDALHENERVNYYEFFIESHIQAILYYLLDDKYTMMPLALGKKLVEYYSKNAYASTPALYKRLALYLPYDILPQLKQFAESTSTEYAERYFKTHAAEMMRIVEIRNNNN